MGPGGHFGPPPNAMNEKLKEPLPKKLGEVPGYLKRVAHSFFSRLLYVIKLVWEAKKSLLIMMIFVAAFNGISPVFAAYISANLLNRVAEVLSLKAPALDTIISVLLPAMLLQFGYMFLASLINSVSNMITRISGEVVTNYVKCKIMNKAKEIDLLNLQLHPPLGNQPRQFKMELELLESITDKAFVSDMHFYHENNAGKLPDLAPKRSADWILSTLSPYGTSFFCYGFI